MHPTAIIASLLKPAILSVAVAAIVIFIDVCIKSKWLAYLNTRRFKVNRYLITGMTCSAAYSASFVKVANELISRYIRYLI